MGVRAGLRTHPFAFAQLDDLVFDGDETHHPCDRLSAPHHLLPMVL
jgi:hypothetical protein